MCSGGDSAYGPWGPPAGLENARVEARVQARGEEGPMEERLMLSADPCPPQALAPSVPSAARGRRKRKGAFLGVT